MKRPILMLCAVIAAMVMLPVETVDAGGKCRVCRGGGLFNNGFFRRNRCDSGTYTMYRTCNGVTTVTRYVNGRPVEVNGEAVQQEPVVNIGKSSISQKPAPPTSEESKEAVKSTAAIKKEVLSEATGATEKPQKENPPQKSFSILRSEGEPKEEPEKAIEKSEPSPPAPKEPEQPTKEASGKNSKSDKPFPFTLAR